MAALDPKTLAELKSLMGDNYKTVFQAFIKSAQQCLDDLASAIENNETHKTERASHTLKGSSANIGAVELSSLCAEMVAMARNSVPQGYTEVLQEILAEYDRVKAEIAVLLAE